MSYVTSAWLEHRLRPDWQRLVRPDAYRLASPGSLKVKVPGRLDAAVSATEQEAFEREVEALRAANARVRIELAEVKYELAWRRFVRKYSPDQPRVPAANPDGGQ